MTYRAWTIFELEQAAADLEHWSTPAILADLIEQAKRSHSLADVADRLLTHACQGPSGGEVRAEDLGALDAALDAYRGKVEG